MTPERRQLTVMFCDLVGSTALSEQLEVDDLMEVMRDYQWVCVKVVRRFDGVVARYAGDGVLAHFGYPVAHEDDAMRAVRAGKGIIEAVEGLSRRFEERLSIRVKVRVGIHTGVAIAGDLDDSGELETMALIGETPNIAARLQELAKPNSVLISSATHRLTEGFFDCTDLGHRTLKGVSHPVKVFEVVGESTAKSRLEALEARRLTPLVGRDREVEELMERWSAVREGRGQVVLVEGEAGIGKSRIAHALKTRVTNVPDMWARECRCSSYEQNTAFYPIVELLERDVLGFSPSDTVESKLAKLEGWLLQRGLDASEALPLFAKLMSLSLRGQPPTPTTPERQRQQTMDAILAMLLDQSKRQPLLLIVEDVHWADPSTLELLERLVKVVSGSRILLIVSCRPQFEAAWTSDAHVSRLGLKRLSETDVRHMVADLGRAADFTDEIIEQVVAKSDGVPLFVEELVRMVLEWKSESGSAGSKGQAATLGIPTALQDLLMARLDRLAADKTVVRLAAALGRSFPYEWLRSVTSLDEPSLQQELGHLVEAGILYREEPDPGAGGGVIYSFKHALIQEAGYQSLLRTGREAYHGKIAHTLRSRFPETARSRPELMAHHLTRAGQTTEAVQEWLRAGQRAIERSANQEAVYHLSKGLELLESAPDTPERWEQELALQCTVGVPYLALRGFASPDAERVYSRARALCSKIGETPQVIPALLGMGSFYVVRAELSTALGLAEQVMRLAESAGDRASTLGAHSAVGVIAFWQGWFVRAREHLERALGLYDREQDRMLAFVHGQDWGVVSLSHLAMVLWILGYPDQAAARGREAVDWARELGHPFSLAYALNFSSWVHQFRGEADETRARADDEIALAGEQAFPLWLAGGTILSGWAQLNERENAVGQIQDGLAGWQMTGAVLARMYYLALLAEARLGLKAEEALETVGQAFDAMKEDESRFWLAELHRVKGRALVRAGDPSKGESALRDALETAREQGARSLELRTAMELLELAPGDESVRSALASVVDGFTEGLDTADLTRAQRLLNRVG